jgi:hypothetical protein
MKRLRFVSETAFAAGCRVVFANEHHLDMYWLILIRQQIKPLRSMKSPAQPDSFRGSCSLPMDFPPLLCNPSSDKSDNRIQPQLFNAAFQDYHVTNNDTFLVYK